MATDRKQEWKEKVWGPATERSRERQARFETTSDIEIDPIYTPEDVANQDYDRDLGFPGSFPYTRGVQPTMYRGRIWTMRQYSGFASAEETNRRYRYLLEQGQTGLSMGLRPAHSDRLRFRPSHSLQRSRQGRGAHLSPGGHGDRLSGHQPG